jgi:hypothetical protein
VENPPGARHRVLPRKGPASSKGTEASWRPVEPESGANYIPLPSTWLNGEEWENEQAGEPEDATRMTFTPAEVRAYYSARVRDLRINNQPQWRGPVRCIRATAIASASTARRASPRTTASADAAFSRPCRQIESPNSVQSTYNATRKRRRNGEPQFSGPPLIRP